MCLKQSVLVKDELGCSSRLKYRPKVKVRDKSDSQKENLPRVRVKSNLDILKKVITIRRKSYRPMLRGTGDGYKKQMKEIINLK